MSRASTSCYYQDETVTLQHGDAAEVLACLPRQSVNCIVTSPPYLGLRDYGVAGQIGAEASPDEYVAHLVAVFAQARRVLAGDGTLWLNLGDSYASQTGWGRGAGSQLRGRKHGPAQLRPGSTVARFGVPRKNLLGMPWRVALALQDDGWILRSDIIWEKTNPMPSSAGDRPKAVCEHVFLFSKRARYWFDPDALDGAGDVWRFPTASFPGPHCAVMPLGLAERCVRAGCKPAGTVLDPFSGTGTTGAAALRFARNYVGVDLNAAFLDLSLRTRLEQQMIPVAATR